MRATSRTVSRSVDGGSRSFFLRRRAEPEVRAVPVKDATQVKSVIEKFRDKYGAKDVKKYYSKFDVAVLAHMR